MAYTTDDYYQDKVYYNNCTPSEKLEYMDALRKNRKQGWDAKNADKVFQYRRATTLKRCEQRVSVPTKSTIQKYNFTVAELKPIFDALWNSYGDTPANSPVSPVPVAVPT